MTGGQNRRAVGLFSNRTEVEKALHELRDADFPMNKVSVIAKNARHGNLEDAGAGALDDETEAEEGARKGAIAGGALGTIAGLLVGLGALAIPGIGPVMVAGATATALATAISGGAIGAAAGGLIGGLIGLGIPEERARLYSDRVSRGDYLIVVDGTDTEIAMAQSILNRWGIQEWGIYDPFGVAYPDAPYTSGIVDPRESVPRTSLGQPII